MSLRTKFQRGWWLYKSAGLSPVEILNLFLNKIIYFSSRSFYSAKSFFYYGQSNIIAGYARHIPKKLPKKNRKQALLAYLPKAYYKENYVGNIKYYFSNNGCPLAMGRALNELGYEVDVIDTDDADFRPKKNYDIAIFHNTLLAGLYKSRLPASTSVVYFEVVAYWRTALANVQKRYDEFVSRHVSTVLPMDLEPYQKIAAQGQAYDAAIAAVDARIVMGDQLVESFSGFNNVYMTTSGCFQDGHFKKDLSPLALEKGRKNFIFFGGSYHNIRKGLDLLFEAFIGTPHHLYVCSSVYDFLLEAYDIASQSNIHLMGYQKQGSKQFYDLMQSCNFVIHPSCAEGIPGGVLDTMKYGLIPIVSRQCNIVSAKAIGVQLETCTVEEIRAAINFSAGQPVAWMAEHAQMAINESRNTYSVRAFMEDFKHAVTAVATGKK